MIHLFRTSSITSIAYKTPKRNEKTQEAMNRAMKKWNLQYEKLVEFRQKIGHCIVPFRYEDDKSLGLWVHKQRSHHTKNIMRPDRKDLLDELGFAWKPSTLAARRSPTTDDVRGLAIASFHAWVESCSSHSFCSYLILRVGFGFGFRFRFGSGHHQRRGYSKRSNRRNGTSTTRPR